jgi:pilus assembly protein Flp/PilA
MESLKRFVDGEQGVDLIEYALLAGLISLACLTSLGLVGTQLNTLYTAIKTKIPTTIP